MKSPTRILLAGFNCLLFTTSLVGQKDTFAPATDGSFKISTNRSSYRAGEEIILEYRIINISNAPLYVPREWELSCPGAPHFWAWFEDSSGQHFVPGYGGSCSSNPRTIGARMSREAVLLKPSERLDGSFRLNSKLFGLKPGVYRIEATLSGWMEEKFTDEERAELARIGYPFLRGELPDSMRIRLAR